MSTNATDDGTEDTAVTTDLATDERTRYAELTIGDDEFVVYDRENHDAWIKSTMALDVGEAR